MIDNKKSNRLANEKSPYLLQHAYNPINWYTWEDEAFKKAKEEDKPIFLSIGYSTCHWCHVMHEESFDDEEVASILNENFISIKVDKEIRPDIDKIYMNICQMVTGSGGWPLTVIMDSDKIPLYVGTYLPKNDSRYGMGLIALLNKINMLWKNEREQLQNLAEKTLNHIKEEEVEKYNNILNFDIIDKAVSYHKRTYDSRYGGFGNAPKFPAAHNLLFLLNYYQIKKDKFSLDIVKTTLTRMYQGGLFDHIGYGFSRYATDRKWLIPHFEKMLYDNALLIWTYNEYYKLSNEEIYKEIADRIFIYLQSEMTNEEGAFYSAQDADSDNEEGAYYTFSYDEVRELLNDNFNDFANHFNITEKGNFEGKNIFNLVDNDNLKSNQFQKEINILYNYRKNRMNLFKDRKIKTSWNCLMIIGYLKSYQATQDVKYLNAALNAYYYLDKKLFNDGNLYIGIIDGHILGNGKVDDYVYYDFMLLTFYEVTYDIKYLAKLLNHLKNTINQFYDSENGGLFIFEKQNQELIHNIKEIYDGEIPSANSVFLYLLERIVKLTDNYELKEILNKHLNFILNKVNSFNYGYNFTLIGIIQDLQPSKLLIITSGNNNIENIKEYMNINSKYDLSVILKTKDNSEVLHKLIPYLENYKIDDDITKYYLCENFTCNAPLTDINELNKYL